MQNADPILLLAINSVRRSCFYLESASDLFVTPRLSVSTWKQLILMIIRVSTLLCFREPPAEMVETQMQTQTQTVRLWLFCPNV